MIVEQSKVTDQRIIDIPELKREEVENMEDADDGMSIFQTESVANGEQAQGPMFKKTGQKIKFKGMFSMISEADVTENKDDPNRGSNKENHDGIFKKISFGDGPRKEDGSEGDLSPFPYIPRAKLRLMKARTKLQTIKVETML